MSRPGPAVVALLALSLACPAAAVVLTTPPVAVGSDQAFLCTATNPTDKPVPLASVTLFDTAGGTIVPDNDFCTLLTVLDPRASCQVIAPRGVSGYCIIDVGSKKARGAAAVAGFFSPNDTAVVVPATK